MRIRNCALTGLVLLGYGVFAQSAPIVTEYSTSVDLSVGTATFSVVFDSPPDFSTIVSGDLGVLGSLVYPQVLQFNIDPTGMLPGSGRSDGGHTVTPAMRTLACDAGSNEPGGQTCHEGSYNVYSIANQAGGGLGNVPYSVIGNVFALTVPLSLINDSNGFFTYSIEDGFPGASVRNFFFGTSGITHSAPFGAVPEPAAVPEPETYAMMLAGLVLLGVGARRRKQKEAP